MVARDISHDEVRLVLNNPDSTAPGDDGATNAWRWLNDRRLRITFSKTSVGKGKRKQTTVLIITAAIAEERKLK